MKKLLAFLLLAAPVYAQPPYANTYGALITFNAADPAGACSTGRFWWNTTSNAMFVCENAVWASQSIPAGSIPYPLLAPNGTSAAPSYSFSATPNTGMYHAGSSTIGFTGGGFEAANISNAFITVPAASQFRFASTSNPGGAADTGLARAGAGIVSVTNGAAGTGQIQVPVLRSTAGVTMRPSTATSSTSGFSFNVRAATLVPEFSGIDNSGNGNWFQTNNLLTILGNAQFGWSSSATSTGFATNVADTGLARQSAGFVRVSDGSTGFGRLIVADGTASTPGLSFGASVGTRGFYNASGSWFWSASPATYFAIGTTGIGLSSDSLISFVSNAASAGGPAAGGADSGIARQSVGIVRATDGSSGLGAFMAKDGALGSVGFMLGTAGNTGFYLRSSASLETVLTGTAELGVDASGAVVNSGDQFAWSSGSLSSAGRDTGLARAAAGFVTATNGGANIGAFLAESYRLRASGAYAGGGDTTIARVQPGLITISGTGVTTGTLFQAYLVDANTGTGSPPATNSDQMFTNTGDTDGSTINLPNDPQIGTVFTITATVAQNITIVPAAGETVMFGNTVCTTSFVVGGAATGIGDSVTVVAATGGSGAVWITTAFAGTPTCTP